MPDPREIVNNALTGETDEPSQYVDWLSQKTELGNLQNIKFGYFVITSNEDTIRENAVEAGILKADAAPGDDEAFWEQMNKDIGWLEANAQQIGREAGLYVQDEGHGPNGDRYASAWILATLPQEQQITLAKKILDVDEMLSTTSGTLWKFFPTAATQLYRDVSEEGRKVLDVSVEFSDTEPLREWLRLNLLESTDVDDPETFVKHYVPRLKGDLNVDFNAIKPNFPDVPNYFYRQNVDGLILFRYKSASEMRDVLQQMKYNDGSDLFPKTYSYKVPNPRLDVLSHEFLEQAGANAETMELIEKTNAPIYFYIPVDEFHNYMRLVYPQVKLREDLAVDDPETFIKSYHKTCYKLFYGRKFGEGAFVGVYRNLDDALTAAKERKLRKRGKYVWAVEEILPDAPGENVIVGSEPTGNIYYILKGYQLSEPQRVTESEDVDDPAPYLDRVTGWIDTFLNAGFTPNLEDTHRGQFWKRYECHGFNYLVHVGTRVPRWITVERNDALYGTNAFRRVFEYPDRYITGMTQDFAALDRLLTRARTSAFEHGHSFDHKIEDLYQQHKRNRQKFLDGRLKEAVDDPEVQRYLDQASPEACKSCGLDLTLRHSVVREYVQNNGLTHELSGHYAASDSAFENDEQPSANLLAVLTSCPTFNDLCNRCGRDPNMPRQQEGIDDPEHYLKGNVYTFDELRTKLETYGLSFPSNGIRPWGRWAVIDGFTYWAVYSKDPDKYLPQSYFRVQLEKFCAEMGFTLHHVQLFGEYPEGITFKLAVPKMQIDPEAYASQERRLNDPDFGNEREAHEIIQREWLPESDDFDAEAEASRLLQTAPMRYNELRDWHPYIHHEYNVYHAPFIVPVFTHTGRLSKANSYLGWVRFKEHTYNEPPTWEAEVAKVRDVVPNKLPGFYPSKLKKRGFQIGEPFDPYRKRFYSLTMAESENPDPDDPAVNIERHTSDLDINAVMAKLGFTDSRTVGANWDGWTKQVGNNMWRIWPTTITNSYGVTRLERPAKYVQVGRGRRHGQWSDKGHFVCHVSELEQQLREEGALNPPPVEEALDPDDPEHYLATTPPFTTVKSDEQEYGDNYLVYDVYKRLVGRISVDVNKHWNWVTVDRRYLKLSDEAWINYFNSQNELLLAAAPFVVKPVDEVDEALAVPDPDDPSVNVERHITSMVDIDAIMDRLGFMKMTPTWKCSDPDYCWYQLHHGQFKWTVTRKSDDEPHIFEVDVSRYKPLDTAYGGTVPNYQQIGSAKVHVGDLENKIKEVLRKPLTIIWRGMGIHPDEVDESVADPDAPEPNIERFAQHKQDEEAQALDTLIQLAVKDYEIEIDKRGIDDARRADELVGDVAFKWASHAGYENGSDEYDWIVSALNNKAGELFPGNWEDYPPEDHPVQESDLVSDKMDWTEFFAPLIEYNQLSQQAADRYAISQNLESNEKLYYLFLEADEASQYANDADYNACIDKILRIIRVTNMRYNSAIKGIMRDVPLDEAKDDVDAEAYIKSQPLEVMARAYNVRDRSDALKFNCAPWFEQATLEDLVDLAKGSTLYGPFNRSFSADMVAGHMARLIPALKELLDRSDKLDVYINEDDAKRWMEHNRADWYAYLWPNDMLGEGVADPDDIDPKQYAMSLEVFDPTKVVEDMTAMGWKSAGLRLAYPDENVWLLEWWSYKELTNDMPEAAYQAEAKMALEDAKKAVKNACPEADQFEWYAPFSDGDFGLYFKIPERLKPLKTRTWENLDDPTPELLHSTFDVPTILKRMGYERHGEQQEWSKDFRRYPTDLDLMIGVRRRGLGGESNEGDALYDITLYIYPVHDNPEKRWSEVAHRYSRNNLQLERVLKVLEARIKANNLRGIVPDPDITENLELDDPDAVEPPPGHYLKQLCDLNLTDTLQAHGLGSNLNGNYGSGTIKLGNKATLQYHGVRQFNGVNVAISMYSFRQVASVSCYLQPRYDRDVLTKKKFVFRFRSIPICKLPEVINTMLTDITDICRNNLGTWPEMMTQFKAKMAQFNQYRPFNVKTKVAKPVAEAADPDDPEMVLAAHTQDLVADPDVPNKIHSHTHGKLTSDLEALGFETSWVAGRGVIFGEPYVPTFWSKRYPAANRSRILFVEISNEHGNVVLGLRTRFMPVPIRLKPRSMDHLLVIVRDTDAVMQRAAAENLAKPQERDALLDTLEKHQQWCVKEAVEEPVPDPDDPETVLKSYQHGLLDGELKRLGFAPIFTQGVTHLYGRPMLDYWTKEYTATDGSQRALYLYFMSGHKPAIRANNWNPIAKAWYQRGKEWPTDALGKSEAHFCAIIRDLDAAMSRSAADSLPPDQEHEAVEAILKHHREWYDQTLTNWHSHGITGQIGPGRPA